MKTNFVSAVRYLDRARRRILSLLLALVMVLGMVPAGLLPQARAAASDLSYEVSFTKVASGWEYTVTFSGGSAGAPLGNVYFALVPDYSSSGGSVSPSHQIGEYLNNGQASVGAFEGILKNIMGDVEPVAVQKPGDKRYDDNGMVQFTGTLTDAYYQELQNLYSSKPSNFGSSSTDGIPMCVVMTNFGGTKYVSGGAAEWKGEAAKAELTATPNSIQFPRSRYSGPF